MHDAAGRERVVLAVLSEHDVETVGEMGEPTCVLERRAHEPGVLQADTVLGEDADPGPDEFGHRRELLTGSADGHGRRRDDLAQGIRCRLEDLLHDCCAVGGGGGARHRDAGCETAECRAAGAGVDRLGFFVARLSEVDVQIDEPRDDHQPVGIDDGVAVQAVAHLGDVTAHDEEIGPPGPFGVDDRRIRDGRAAADARGGGHAIARWSSTMSRPGLAWS